MVSLLVEPASDRGLATLPRPGTVQRFNPFFIRASIERFPRSGRSRSRRPGSDHLDRPMSRPRHALVVPATLQPAGTVGISAYLLPAACGQVSIPCPAGGVDRPGLHRDHPFTSRELQGIVRSVERYRAQWIARAASTTILSRHRRHAGTGQRTGRRDSEPDGSGLESAPNRPAIRVNAGGCVPCPSACAVFIHQAEGVDREPTQLVSWFVAPEGWGKRIGPERSGGPRPVPNLCVRVGCLPLILDMFVLSLTPPTESRQGGAHPAAGYREGHGSLQDRTPEGRWLVVRQGRTGVAPRVVPPGPQPRPAGPQESTPAAP